MSQNEVVIPEGVVYKKANKEINESAKKLLEKELVKPEYNLFVNHLYCGPNIWYRYKDIHPLNQITKGDITFEVPQGNKTYNATGKLIQSKDDFSKIWNQVIKDFKNTNYTLRKLNQDEIKYHWSIIFYDIEEPIFILENNKFQVIVDFNEDLKVIWIEQIVK